MKHEGDDLLLDDPAFLETIAAGFEKVKIRPRENTASEISNANAGTRQFRDRAVRLRAIARRVRLFQEDQRLRQRHTMDNDSPEPPPRTI